MIDSRPELAPLANRPPSGRFPRWLLAAGLILLVGTAALDARLIWEQTVWSWERGPQMVGFSLVHGPYGAPLLLSATLLCVWLAISLIYLVWRLAKRRPLSRTSLIAVGVSVGLLGILCLPYGFWQRQFAARLASGPHAGEFLTYAAAVGDLDTVKALVARGVSIDARDHEGKTSLHGAAVEGQMAVIQYLIANGADVNAIDRWGDSPLENAASQNHDDAAKFLLAHGAQRVHGTTEQRKKAACEIVRDGLKDTDPYFKQKSC